MTVAEAKKLRDTLKTASGYSDLPDKIAGVVPGVGKLAKLVFDVATLGGSEFAKHLAGQLDHQITLAKNYRQPKIQFRIGIEASDHGLGPFRAYRVGTSAWIKSAAKKRKK